MYDEFLLTYKVGFLMTVAKLYDEGYSVAEIAQQLKKDEYMSVMPLPVFVWLERTTG